MNSRTNITDNNATPLSQRRHRRGVRSGALFDGFAAVTRSRNHRSRNAKQKTHSGMPGTPCFGKRRAFLKRENRTGYPNTNGSLWCSRACRFKRSSRALDSDTTQRSSSTTRSPHPWAATAEANRECRWAGRDRDQGCGCSYGGKFSSCWQIPGGP